MSLLMGELSDAQNVVITWYVPFFFSWFLYLVLDFGLWADMCFGPLSSSSSKELHSNICYMHGYMMDMSPASLIT